MTDSEMFAAFTQEKHAVHGRTGSENKLTTQYIQEMYYFILSLFIDISLRKILYTLGNRQQIFHLAKKYLDLGRLTLLA
jgi:hypothetical protein